MPYNYNDNDETDKSEDFRHNGDRIIHPGSLKADRLTRNFRSLPQDVSPFAIFPTFERAAAAYRLSDGAVRLARHLWSFVWPEHDFKPGALALVWPENKKLMDLMGLTCVKTLRRYLRELHRAGFISYKDSPNKVRTGYRCPKTNKIDLSVTFGICLTPMAALYNEMIRKIEAYKIQQAYKRHIQNAFRSAKRRAQELLHYAAAIIPTEMLERYQGLFTRIKALYADSERDFKLKESLISRFETHLAKLNDDIETIEASDTQTQDTAADLTLEHMRSYLEENTPEGDISAPPIILSTPLASGMGKGLGGRTVAESAPKPAKASSISRQWEKIRKAREAAEDKKTHKMDYSVSFEQLRASLPYEIKKDLRDDHGEYQLMDLLSDRRDLHGLDPLTLAEGRAAMGIMPCCVALSILIDKQSELRSPRGYFKKLINLHKIGKFNQAPSMFGIVSRNLKPQAEQGRLAMH